MALVLIAEDGTGLSTANALCDVAFADSYFERHLHASGWTAASSAQKTAGLVWGAELLMYHFIWDGVLATTVQALPFPRLGATDREGVLIASNVVPEVVKRANAEMGRYLLAKDRTLENATRGYEELRAGPVEMVIDKHDRIVVPPDSVIAMLVGLGRINSPTEPARFARLLRT